MKIYWCTHVYDTMPSKSLEAHKVKLPSKEKKKKKKNPFWAEEAIKIKGQLSGRSKGRVPSYYILTMNQTSIGLILILFSMSAVW